MKNINSQEENLILESLKIYYEYLNKLTRRGDAYFTLKETIKNTAELIKKLEKEA